ncbi:MAG: ABC transporter ATP-binding protein [Rhizobiales bacterium]|nr:ABC transporter ATP-binding protein [Hyphomicrobiales bacterium]
MTGARILFSSIRKVYRRDVALSSFSLAIEAGEFVTLLGPSGSGKTTALNILAGFTAASGGTLGVDGKSILDLPPEKREIGMVFQGYSLFPHMTVAQNVAFPLALRRVAKSEIARRVGEALEMVRLGSFGARMPNELSGGQRQRVAFARAVVFRPRVLLMDEPLGALDLKLREAMQLEIKRYHAELGCTVIFVTHDQGEALALSDRIAVMTDGEIAQVGTPAEIYDRPDSQYVAEFVGRINVFPGQRRPGNRIEIPDLGLTAALPDTVAGAAAETVNMCVRPEDVEIVGPADASGMLACDATVEEAYFLGDTVSYSVALAAGRRITVEHQRRASTPIMPAGSRLRLGIRMSSAHYFPAV